MSGQGIIGDSLQQATWPAGPTTIAANSSYVKLMDGTEPKAFDEGSASSLLAEPRMQKRRIDDEAAVSIQPAALSTLPAADGGYFAIGPSTLTLAHPSSEGTTPQQPSLKTCGGKGRLRKVWLHTSVEPALGGTSNQIICRYCGTILSSNNISVRKKVSLAWHAASLALSQCMYMTVSQSMPCMY